MRPRPYCRPALLPKPNQKSETMVEVCVTRPCFQVSSRNILEIQHAQWLGSRYGLSCFHGGQFLGYSNACPTKYWVWRMKVSLPHGLGARSLSFALMCSRRHMLSHITKSKDLGVSLTRSQLQVLRNPGRFMRGQSIQDLLDSTLWPGVSFNKNHLTTSCLLS